ncbi:hypothetical protein CR513_33696, partial [Mucuna pruriens]
MIVVTMLKPLEPPYPKNYDPNAKCDYHRGAIGHPIEKCWGLKHKENELNVNNNPLLAHEGQSVNALSHERLKHEPDETGSSQTHSAQVVAEDLLPKSLIIRYDPIHSPRAPLIIQVLAKPVYSDNHTVPWQYNPIEVTLEEKDPTKEVTNIAEPGGVTRSGKIYTPNTLRKKISPSEPKGVVVENAKDPTIGKEAEEFLKLIRHSKILNEVHVAQDITLEKFGGIVNNLTVGSRLSFSKEEILAKGRGHNQPFHIFVKCDDYKITRVLIDNGSSLNVLPKITLDKLCSTSSSLKSSSIIVRAFDRSKREVMGEVTLPFRIGPTTFDITFQVMDIRPAYNCLLGRP